VRTAALHRDSVQSTHHSSFTAREINAIMREKEEEKAKEIKRK
jgi:hypothetical protein